MSVNSTVASLVGCEGTEEVWPTRRRESRTTEPRRNRFLLGMVASSSDETMWVTVWKFLHIAAMFGAVSIFVGQGLLTAAIASTQDVRAIRHTVAAEARFGPAGGALFLLGIVFGVVTALTGELDLTTPWLLIAYGLVVIIFVTGIAYHGPRGRKLQILAEASSETEPSEELRALIQAPSARIISAFDLVVWLAVIYVMVAKPFA
jgi:hypothetical protein